MSATKLQKFLVGACLVGLIALAVESQTVQQPYTPGITGPSPAVITYNGAGLIPGSVPGSALQANSIGQSNVQANAIAQTNLQANAVAGTNIQANAVGQPQLAIGVPFLTTWVAGNSTYVIPTNGQGTYTVVMAGANTKLVMPTAVGNTNMPIAIYDNGAGTNCIITNNAVANQTVNGYTTSGMTNSGARKVMVFISNNVEWCLLSGSAMP